MPVIKAKSRAGDAVQYQLTEGQDLVVAQGVKVESYTSDAILSVAGAHTVTIAGTVIGYEAGIVFGPTIHDGTDTLNIESTGKLVGVNDSAATFYGRNSLFVNEGTVIADEGVEFGWSDPGTVTGTARVVNSGLIHFTDFGFYGTTDIRLNLKNTGTIYMIDEAIVEAGAQDDVVVNRGEMYGYMYLGDGADFYDGFGGIQSGRIYGDNGNDRFRAGRGADDLDGGNDFDTVDYRSGGAITVFLDGSTGRKAAGGDRLNSIENLIGSTSGSDRIVGHVAGERLSGLGGQDTLVGAGGADTLIGGVGRDLINATDTVDGIQDQIVFNTLADAGDRIINFSFSDEVMISRAGFGAGGTLGGLEATPDRFFKDATNKAQDAEDRFVFRTNDNTLWFDKDGNKGQFDPVLIGTFDGAGNFDVTNITLF